MGHLFLKLATVLCLALATGTAAAQRNLKVTPAASNDQRFALVIGNSAYKEAPLRNPVNDATDMAAALRALGFSVTLRTNADTRQMRTAIREFAQNLKRGGVGLFYFAGHGVQARSGRNYLIPVGSDIKEEFELEDEAVDANRVLAGMEEAGNRVNIVILDACRNNPFARSWRSASSGLAQMSAPTGSFVGFATSPGSVAADGSGRNGIYTRHLLANLKDSELDIDRVFTRVTAGVAKETGNKQVPWKSSSLTEDFYFRPPSGSAQVASVAPNIAASRPPAAPGSIAAMPPGTVFRDCADCPEMVAIPPGSFTMGSPASEPQRDSDEGPQHQVTISRPFAAGKYELTFDEWEACVRDGGCRHNPSDSGWGKGRRPVINVSWNDAKEYVDWLSRRTGRSYRLFTESEWEYAARAGTSTAFSTGATLNPTQANFDSAVSYAGSATAVSSTRTVPVGGYAPNAFGLHDVHGNVWEWTEDCLSANYDGARGDGSAWLSGGDCGRRRLRGGSWGFRPGVARSAYRGLNGYATNTRLHFIGFRVARTD